LRTTVRALIVSETLKAWPTTMREWSSRMAQRMALAERIHGADLGSVHEIRNPEIIDVFDFVGFAHIGPILERKPSLFFDHRSKVL